MEVACFKIATVIPANFDNAETMQLRMTDRMMFPPCLLIEIVQDVQINRCLEVQRLTFIRAGMAHIGDEALSLWPLRLKTFCFWSLPLLQFSGLMSMSEDEWGFDDAFEQEESFLLQDEFLPPEEEEPFLVISKNIPEIPNYLRLPTLQKQKQKLPRTSHSTRRCCQRVRKTQ